MRRFVRSLIVFVCAVLGLGLVPVGVAQVNPPKVVVRQKGNGWFRVEFPSSWTFPENDYLASRLAWARASDLQIPPNSIELDASYVNVEKGVDKTLHATVLEDYANDVTMSWTASDTAVASVSGTGRVVAKIEGTSRVTVKAASSHGVEVTDSALVSVYTPISEDTVGKTTKAVSLFRGAVSSSPVLASLSSGAQVSITGVSGEFWLVEADGRTGFVAKSAVTIPVVSVTLSQGEVTVAPGGSVQLSVVVKPANVTDKTVRWVSSSRAFVTVDEAGLVRGVKNGRATLTASAGGLSSSANVAVKSVVSQVKMTPAKLSIPHPELSLVIGVKNQVLTLDTLAEWCSHKLFYKVAGGVWKYAGLNASGCVLKSVRWNHKLDKSLIGKKVYWKATSYRDVGFVGEKLDSSVVQGIVGRPGTSVAGKVTASSAVLTWEKVGGSAGYVVFQCDKYGKKCKQVAVLKGADRLAYTRNGLQANTKYVFKIAAASNCVSKAGKLICELVQVGGKAGGKNPLFSEAVKVQTEMTRQQKIVHDVTNAAIKDSLWNDKTESALFATNKAMLGQSLNWGRKDKAFPWLRYRWDGDGLVLYLHVAIRFVLGNHSQTVSKKHPKYKDRSEASLVSWFKQGVVKYWSTDVVGKSGYDFMNNVKFSTKIVLEEYSAKKSYPKGQSWLYVYVGTEDQSSCKSKSYPQNNNWYHADVQFKYQVTGGGRAAFICMPWDHQVVDDVAWGPSQYMDEKSIKLIAGHEFGHMMGLDDSYDFTYSVDRGDGSFFSFKADQLKENKETSISVKGKFENFMKNQWKAGRITSNDFEMALYAYQRAANENSYYWQSYNNYYDSDEDGFCETLISDKIHHFDDGIKVPGAQKCKSPE